MKKPIAKRPQASQKHDPVERRLDMVNRAFKSSMCIHAGRLYFAGTALHMPESVQAVLDDYVYRNRGTPGAVAKRLKSYGYCEWSRRFSNCFPPD